MNTFKCTDHMAMHQRWWLSSASIELRDGLCCTNLLTMSTLIDPYLVELRSKMKSSVKGHMFRPHLVKVHSMTKSSNEGHIIRPHLVKVRSMTKSSDKRHILVHIWLKSAVRQSPPTRGTFWSTFGRSPQ
jgi:hypothetical protein